MALRSELLLEMILSIGLCLATIPLHEYGHKFAHRVLGYEANIIWRSRANEHWWSIGASCGLEESAYFWGTSIDIAFVSGAGGAVQACAFIIPMLFFETFGFFTAGCIFCLFYMIYEIITHVRHWNRQ